MTVEEFRKVAPAANILLSLRSARDGDEYIAIRYADWPDASESAALSVTLTGKNGGHEA